MLAMMKFLLTTFRGVKKSSVIAEPSKIQSSLSNGLNAAILSTPSATTSLAPSLSFVMLSIVAFSSPLSSLPA